MKILHVISGLTAGGAEGMLVKLAAQMRREGHVPVVACLGPGGGAAQRLRDEGIETHFLGFHEGTPGVRGLRGLWRLARLTRRVDPDVIQGWMSHGNLAALFAGVFVKRPQGAGRLPVWWSVHQSVYTLRAETRTNAALALLCGVLSPLARGVVFVSRASAALHQRLGYAPDRSTVIPVGFDSSVFVPFDPARRAEARRRLGLDPEALWVGLVARDDPKKDPRNFLRAAARVAARVPSARFLLLGRGMDHPDHPLVAFARAAGLQGRVLFRGETSEVPAWMASLDLLVSASSTEAFPNVIGEAMACGVPCVVTDVGDSAFLVGEGGLVVPPRDSEALAAAMQRLLEEPPSARAERGRRGRARIETRFTIEAVARRYADLYRG